MGSVIENKRLWTVYDWQRQGDEWSDPWGGTEQLWAGTILPRIREFLPTGTILEIAPGYGRCTQYLLEHCRHMTIVDLAENCIEACRRRFGDSGRISYYVNDGKSLDMVEDGSIDFVFSFDSLVHVEGDVVEAYIEQLTRKLRPNGVGFLHHSNMAAYARPDGSLPFWLDNRPNGSNWRGTTMSAELFERLCERVGLQCIRQETIAYCSSWSLRWLRPDGPMRFLASWLDRRGAVLNDCLSTFTPKGSSRARPNVLTVNRRFMAEAARFAASQSAARPIRPAVQPDTQGP